MDKWKIYRFMSPKVSYALKNRITPELKKRFLEEIKRSIKTGKETGFLICLNDKLYTPKKRCTGTECGFL